MPIPTLVTNGAGQEVRRMDDYPYGSTRYASGTVMALIGKGTRAMRASMKQEAVREVAPP